MSTQEKPNENPLVKLVKKSVGLPTSDCCDVSVQMQAAESGCGEKPAVQTKATGCGCGAVESARKQA